VAESPQVFSSILYKYMALEEGWEQEYVIASRPELLKSLKADGIDAKFFFFFPKQSSIALPD
jgi:hypothetical protein